MLRYKGVMEALFAHLSFAITPKSYTMCWIGSPVRLTRVMLIIPSLYWLHNRTGVTRYAAQLWIDERILHASLGQDHVCC